MGWSSDVQICNGALGLLGAERIVAIAGSDNTRSKWCEVYYEQARDETVAGFPWNFATRRKDLGAALASTDADAPVYEWSYAFTLPRIDDDWCLRVIDTENGDPYRVEGKILYCDSSSIRIKYLRRIVAPGDMSDHCKGAIAAKLAMYLAYPLTKSSTMQEAMAQLYVGMIDDAHQTDTQEGTPEEIDSDEILAARYGYYNQYVSRY